MDDAGSIAILSIGKKKKKKEPEYKPHIFHQN